MSRPVRASPSAHIRSPPYLALRLEAHLRPSHLSVTPQKQVGWGQPGHAACTTRPEGLLGRSTTTAVWPRRAPWSGEARKRIGELRLEPQQTGLGSLMLPPR